MKRTRRANIAVTALSLGIVLGFGALAVDIAYVRVANAQLQSAVDSAVLAAAGRLDGTADGVDAARQLAVDIVALNVVVGGHTLDPDDLLFGHADEDGAFVPLGAADADQINAVRVDANHKGLNAVLAGAAFGKNKLTTAARAMAVRPVGGPASAVDCYLPIVLPDCHFDPNATTNPGPEYITPKNDNDDNMAWATHVGGNANAVKSHLQNEFCTDTIGIGDDMHLTNGSLATALQTVADLLNDTGSDIGGDWPLENFPDGVPDERLPGSMVDDSSWGRVLGGPIAIVTGFDCNNPKFNKAHEIVGFTWGFIYDVHKHKGDMGMMLQLDFVNEYDAGSGVGGDMGNIITPNGPPRLVSF